MRRNLTSTFLVLAVASAAILCAASRPVSAAILYVDNMKGNDGFDGRATEAASNDTGPTLTIGRALQLARTGDTIVIANTGKTYYESISIVGRRHSGIIGRPFTIIGNGAVLDGSAPVHPKAWRRVGKDMWRMTPWRKGFYQLVLDDKPVPEHRPKTAGDERPAVPVGKWLAWKGAIYYQAAAGEKPGRRAFRYAARSVGITLYEASDVQVLDLTIRFFRLDGVNAHDRSLRVKVENVKSLANGRSGVAVGGTSAVVVRDCEITDNRRHSVLLTELGAVKVEDSKLSRPPTLPED